jgi:hypothetical protein
VGQVPHVAGAEVELQLVALLAGRLDASVTPTQPPSAVRVANRSPDRSRSRGPAALRGSGAVSAR